MLFCVSPVRCGIGKYYLIQGVKKMPDGSLWTIALMLVCLAFSGFFSSTETAYTSINKTRMKNLAADGNKKAALALKLCENYDKFLSTILVGNNIVNIALSSVATVWFIQLLSGTSVSGYASAISTAVITVVVLIFGEITPKSLAKDHPEGFAMAVAGFLRIIMFILMPINVIFMLWKKLITKIFKPAEEVAVTEGEVLTLVDEAHEDGSIDEYSKELIENIFEFDDITAGEIATHRLDITMLSIDDSAEEWDDIINNSRFSRYPVYGESVDDILGILDAREYFRLESKTREEVMGKAMAPAYFVPNTVKADVLFKNMKTAKTSFAIVLDEYGGVHGIVTLTDIIKCIVGDFNDNTDEEETEELITLIEENKWQISGAALLSDVEEAIGIELGDEDSDTFGGFVLGLYGSIPEDGTVFDLSTDRLDISVEAISEHKIEKAIVSLRAGEEPEEEK